MGRTVGSLIHVCVSRYLYTHLLLLTFSMCSEIIRVAFCISDSGGLTVGCGSFRGSVSGL